MHAELQILRQTEVLNSVSDGGEVKFHLPAEACNVAYVVHSLIEAAGELRRNRLYGNLFVSDSRENDKKLQRGLGSVGLIHGDLGNEVTRTLLGLNLSVNQVRMLHGGEKFCSDVTKQVLRYFVSSLDLWQRNIANEIVVSRHESVDGGLLCLFSNEVGDVDGIEIAGCDEALDSCEIDVVGIAEILFRPAQLFDCLVGCRACTGRFGTNDEMLAIGFVPDGDYIDASISGLDAGLQLCLRLMGEAVADTDRKFVQSQKAIVHSVFSFVSTNLALNQYEVLTELEEKRQEAW